MRLIELARPRALWLIPIGVCFLLIVPMAFADRTFAPDWGNQAWAVWQQEINIRELGFPSYFIQTSDLGAFYPLFAFYGPTVFAIGGLLAVPLGASSATVLLFFAAFLCTYCGWTWLSIQAGLNGLAAYLPGCIAVTAPYVISQSYGRGDLAETAAASVIPLILASGLSLLRAERLRSGPVAAYVLSIAVLGGTHTITLVWGTTFLLAVAAIAALSWRDVVRARARRVAELAGLAFLGIGISIWFLVPLIAYSHETVIGEHPRAVGNNHYTSVWELLRPLRSTPQLATDGKTLTQTQLPALALICAVVLLALAWRGLPRERRRLAAGVAALLGVVVLLASTPSLLDHLPRFWRFIQLPYRLVTYGDLLVVGLLVLGLTAVRNRPLLFRRATLAGAVIAVIGTAQAVGQAFTVPAWFASGRATEPHSGDALFASRDRAPPTWYAGQEFGGTDLPTAQPTLSRRLEVPVSAPRHLTYRVTYPPGPAGRAETNVTAGSYLIDIEGADPVGVTSYQHIVVGLPASRRPREVSFSARDSAPLVAAQAISVLSLLGTLGLVALLAVRARREAPRPGSERPAAT